jgi:hypothetical protein
LPNTRLGSRNTEVTVWHVKVSIEHL